MAKKKKEPKAPKPAPVWNPTHEECLAATQEYEANGGVVHHMSFKADKDSGKAKFRVRPITPSVHIPLVGDIQHVYQENEDADLD